MAAGATKHEQRRLDPLDFGGRDVGTRVRAHALNRLQHLRPRHLAQDREPAIRVAALATLIQDLVDPQRAEHGDVLLTRQGV